MATANRVRPSAFSLVFRAIAVLVVAGFAGAYFFGAPIAGYGDAGSAYAAKATCSCRYVAERGMASCESDLPSNMWAIWLSDDEAERSVTARVPLVASDTATWREGYGCVLESRDG